MAASGNFDYDRLLSLDQAKLVGRSRLNSLGSYELTLNYNKITSATKEDCLEWLEQWRLTITDPTFSFKTYDGTWNCVSISYNEDRNIIQQIFKIDSSVGNLGEVTDPESYDTQEGDVSRISDGMTIEKAYYWRVTSPTDVVLPTARVGEIWTKTANDNGDGTYDVTVAKEVANNLETTNYTASPLYTEVVEIDTNADSPLPTPLPAEIGKIKTVTNTPLENGQFRTELRTRTAISAIVSKRYKHDYLAASQYPKITVARNYTDAQLGTWNTSGTLLGDMDETMVNSVTISINEYGLYDVIINERFD